MRRFKAVFAKKKQPQVVHHDVLASSASSSSGDHSLILHPPHTVRSWKDVFAPKRAVDITDAARPLAVPLPPTHDILDDDRSDDTSSSSNISPAKPITPGPVHAHAQVPAPSPFALTPRSFAFPRSVNLSATLPPPISLRRSMFRAHLSRRPAPSASELGEIRSLSALDFSTPPADPIDILALPKHTKIYPSSPGVRRWITRPCYEERNVIHSPAQDSSIRITGISASRAIAALEYSEHLDVFVDPDFDSPPESPPPPTFQLATSHASATPDTVSASAQARNSYTATPSPLRNDSFGAAPTPIPDKWPQRSPEEADTNAAVKRIVRFVEEDGDDGSPLHLIRMKKKREQKANFLHQERLKRAQEEEDLRRQQQILAAQLETEALDRERRRAAMEKEKRERDKATYAEAIVEARLRRETQRAGGRITNNSSNAVFPAFLGPSTSWASLKDSEQRNRRASTVPPPAPSVSGIPPALSIPRRDSLHPNGPSIPNYFSDSTPSPSSSSRPPSIAANSPLTPDYGGNNSRPPSTYSAHTSSSEDARNPHGSKRTSQQLPSTPVMGPSSYPGVQAGNRPPMIAGHATWSGSNPHIQYIPPIPAFPDFDLGDMPLLPPTAPFMKPAYKSRTPSNSSRETSRESSTRASKDEYDRARRESSYDALSKRASGSANSSSEMVNNVNGASKQRPSSQQQPRHSSGPASSSAPSTPHNNNNRPGHHRRGSGDSKATTHTQHTTQTSRTTQTTRTNRQSALSMSASSRPAMRSVPSVQTQTPSRGRPSHPARAATAPQQQQMPSQMTQMAAAAQAQLMLQHQQQQHAHMQLMSGQQPMMMVPMMPVGTPMGYMAMGAGGMPVAMPMGMPMGVGMGMPMMSPMGMGMGSMGMGGMGMGMGTGMQQQQQTPRTRVDSNGASRKTGGQGNGGQQQQKRPGTIIS